MPRVLLLFLSILVPVVAATQEVGTLTVMDGGLRLIRGATVFQAVEGVRLRPGDILVSSEGSFDQLEFSDGTVVALGPSSQLFLMRSASGRVSGSVDAPVAELVLLTGWLKGETPEKSGAYRYVSPLLGATTQNGTVVIHAKADTADLFVESGSALIGEVNSDANWRKFAAGKSGQFFSRTAGSGASTLTKPGPAFIDAMPRAFKDTLPPRMSRFNGKPPQPVREREANYSDVRPWLIIGRPWKMSLVRRFEPLLSNPAFRTALEAHVNEYPEWEAVLHPRKSSSTAPANSNSNSGSQHQ